MDINKKYSPNNNVVYVITFAILFTYLSLKNDNNILIPIPITVTISGK